MKKKSFEEFVKEANAIHNNKYEYTEYKGDKVKAKIICPIHGEFWQTPKRHLKGRGCPICGQIKQLSRNKITFEEFIKKAKGIHEDDFEYDESTYTNTHNKTKIFCKKCHSYFWQTPHNHVGLKQRCPNCKRVTRDAFIERANKMHHNFYIYTDVDFKTVRDYVDIICPIHGKFSQVVYEHLRGRGCPQCALDANRSNLQEFIEKSTAVHRGKYRYDESEYVNAVTKIKITCPIHGDFWQKPNDHLNGHGCPKCNQSKLESHIVKLLTDSHINFAQQQKFDWLIYEDKMKLDFYLPDYNIAIECQGKQHFEGVEVFGGDEAFIKTQERDKEKLRLCREHGITLLYYSDLLEYKDFLGQTIYHTDKELLDEVKRYEPRMNLFESKC